MRQLTLKEALDMEGGASTGQECPALLPPDQYLEFLQSMHGVAEHFESILDRSGKTGSFAIAMTRSTGFSCRVRSVDGGHVLLVPLGAPARMYMLARLLLCYWGRERGARMIRSVLDDVPGDAQGVPPLLRAIFIEDHEAERLWENLQQLNEVVESDSRTDPDVRELMHLSLVYLLSHEFTHVLHGHFELRERARAGDLGLSTNEIMRGIETDADDGAAAISMLLLQRNIDEANARGQSADLDLGWLRLTYAVTMLFAVIDAHRKFIGQYDAGAYNHPMVRCELFFEGARRALDAPQSVQQRWITNSQEGWVRCIQALDDLTLDALGGMFGDLPKGVEPAPLHSLLYSAPGGASDSVVTQKCQEATEQMQKVRALLPDFQKS